MPSRNQHTAASAPASTRRGIIERITASLHGLYDEHEARSIALIAVSELSGLSRSALLTDPGAELVIEELDEIIAQLAGGRPVQYVVGRTEFCGHTLAVREGVLIPRPETEELVVWIAEAEPGAGALLDIGTGSGCIAASLALVMPRTAVYAVDISDTALEVAAENFRTLGAQVTLRKADALGDMTVAFEERFDVIVSNPPYVPQRDRAAMHTNVREYEPGEALFVPDDDPLRFYRAIARSGRKMLTPGGRIYFEIYEEYADDMCRLLAEEGYTDIVVRKDMNAKPRMVCCRLK